MCQSILQSFSFLFFFGFLFLYILKFKKKCRFNASHVLPQQYIFPMIPQAATHIHIFFLFCFLEGKINVIKLTTSFQVFFPPLISWSWFFWQGHCFVICMRLQFLVHTLNICKDALPVWIFHSHHVFGVQQRCNISHLPDFW